LISSPEDYRAPRWLPQRLLAFFGEHSRALR
jgi:hypothetical protein